MPIFLSLISFLIAKEAFLENFNRSLEEGLFYSHGGGKITVEKGAAKLILPKANRAGPKEGPNLKAWPSPNFHGDYEVRLKTPKCATTTEGIVSGFFTYFNDGSDYNKDGLTDNSEIDFEWLCAEPESIYLTIWTDYDEASGNQKRVLRKINLAQGKIEYTRFIWGWEPTKSTPLEGKEASPESIDRWSDYDASARFYKYGFSWKLDQIIFWIIDQRTSKKLILWDFQGPRHRIPQVPADLLINLWHSPNWTPEDSPEAIQEPSSDKLMEVDWIRFENK